MYLISLESQRYNTYQSVSKPLHCMCMALCSAIVYGDISHTTHHNKYLDISILSEHFSIIVINGPCQDGAIVTRRYHC